MNGRLAAVCIGIVLAGGFATRAFGYALEHQQWPDGTIPMRLQLAPPSYPLQDGSTSWNAVARNAMDLWNLQLGRVQFTTTEADPATPAADGDRINSVQFSDTVYGDKFGGTTLAVTLLDDNGAGVTTEADVLFNTKVSFNSYRGKLEGSVQDFHRIAIHELGHVLGLDHPDDAGQHVTAIMNSIISDLDHLAADDIQGAQSLYGASNLPAGTGDARLANISTRVAVGTGDSVLIGGFIVQGGSQKKVIMRALGPSLASGAHPVAGVLANPLLELHDGSGAVIATNDNWKETQAAEIQASGVPPPNDLESAIVARLNPGSYTGIVRGADGGAGVALVEIYDLDTLNGRIANISTRGFIGTSDNAMIGGFIIGGVQTKKVIVRALGPSLRSGPTPVAGTISDPILEVHNGNGVILQTNDNWRESPNVTDISNSGLAPSNLTESAVLVTLAPGNYTAIVRGTYDTGVGLVEVFDLD